MTQSEFVARLARLVRLVPICPELEVGLGVPRAPVRIVTGGKTQRLVQPDTGRDLSETMAVFARDYLEGLAQTGVDGFILKSRSPSCGVHTTKLFADVESQEEIGLGSGVFATAVMRRFPRAAVEDEVLLAEPGPRAEFLTRLYGNAARREGVHRAGPAYPDEFS